MAVVTEDASPVEQEDNPREQPGQAAESSSPVNQNLSYSACDVILSALWLALLAGGVEGFYWWARQQFGLAMVFMHPGFLWMSPLAFVVLFTLTGTGLAAVARYTNSTRVLPFAVTLLSLVGWLNALQLMVPGLHFWAWVLLACGLATATGRLVGRHTSPCLTVVRRTVGWMMLGFVAIALSQAVLDWHRERSAVAALPDTPEGAPNVLLVVLDTVRAEALEIYGADREVAPNLSKIAERGVVFNAAWSTAPWTLPSQAGMFTGRLPHELGADWLSTLDATYPTLAEELSAQGWLTGGFVGNTRYCSRETGLARGFSRYEAYRLSWANLAMCTAVGRKLLYGNLPVRFGLRDWPARKRAGEVTAPFTTWLDQHHKRPFFALLNYWDAHDPYFAPPGFQEHAPADFDELLLMRNWWWVHKEGVTDTQVEMLRGAYEDCIRGLDHRIGQLFDELKHRGEWENTLVIITADHGEHFAEHDLLLHGNSLYEPLLHVPLVVVWPNKIPAGLRVDAPVSLRGLPNTVFELLGIEQRFPGNSWARHWNNAPSGPAAPEPIFAEIASQAGFPPCHGRSPVAAGSMRCVRLGDLKYIHNGDASKELYDLGKDPGELNNLASDPEYTQVLEQMQNLLNAEESTGPLGITARSLE